MLTPLLCSSLSLPPSHSFPSPAEPARGLHCGSAVSSPIGVAKPQLQTHFREFWARKSHLAAEKKQQELRKRHSGSV